MGRHKYSVYCRMKIAISGRNPDKINKARVRAVFQDNDQTLWVCAVRLKREFQHTFMLSTSLFLRGQNCLAKSPERD